MGNGEYEYNIGVPQGSCLGPIIWLIIINELLEVRSYKEFYHIQAFADDVMILVRSKVSYKFTELAKEALDKCSEWAEKHGLGFSIEKCSYTVVASKGDISRKPTIKLRNENIKYKGAIKYLGVLIDHRINFLQHIEMVKEKALKIMYKLMRLTKKTWGLGPEIVKETYKVVIEKVLLYASEIWYRDQAGLNKKLKQTQRPFLLAITKCYRTVATNALNVLSGCISLYQTARINNNLYKIYEEGKEVIVDGEVYNTGNSEIRKKRIMKLEDLISVDWMIGEEPKTNISIYTDGSKKENRVGAGVVIYDEKGSREIIKERIGGGNSYVAEIRAIQVAIEEMKRRGRKKFDIFTDSKSALEALRSITYKGEVVEDIKRVIKKEKMMIFLHWIKAHIGIERNEEADRIAKEATEKLEVDTYYKYSRKEIRKRLEKVEKKRWQISWDNTDTGKRVREIYPEVKEERLQGDFKINQAVTGHGCFAEYQQRFFGKSNQCLCGQQQTVEHCIFICEEFKIIRSDLPKDINIWEKHRFYNDYYCRRAIKKIVSALMDFYIPFTHVD